MSPSRQRSLLFAMAIAALSASVGMVRADPPATCSAQDFAAAVDKSGAALRAFTLVAQPKLQAKMRRYGEVMGLDAGQYEDAALDAIQDSRLKTLNEKSASMVLEIDTLGRVEDGAVADCSKLAEIKTRSAELLNVMREKSDYMLARLDEKIKKAGGAPAQAEAKAQPQQSEKAADKKSAPVPKPAKAKPAGKNPQVAKAVPPAKSAPSLAPPPVIVEKLPVAPNSSPGMGMPDEGYTIEEIRDATKGFFGTISTNLATVIEHAFKTWGRPTAYVLGTEGGGAFFAGLRFGEGTLFMRHRALSQPIFWHGPSLGTDVGAAGSRTMFLIYKLNEPGQLYRTFTGVDGSAYFVGGVGLTLLKGGPVIMAPIRSGLGIRIGANIGYLRFGDHATWNPF
jgi:hypothetical protein